MKKILLSLSLIFVLLINNAFPIFRQVQDLEDVQIKRVVISTFTPSLIYIASKNSLYKSQNGAKTFKKVAVFKDEEVSHIFFDPRLANTLYIATTRHLYGIKRELEKLFTSAEEEVIYAAAKFQGQIYIGTSKGAYYSYEDVLNWKKLKRLDGFAIYYIEPTRENLYLATSRGIYLLRDKSKIKRVFVIREDKEEGGLIAKVIKADIFDNKRVWLGTNRGIFSSCDSGKKWKKLYIEGINNLTINAFSQTELERDVLYLATPKGFFRVDLAKKTSQDIYQGLYTPQVNWIEFSQKGKVYLATSKGIFVNDYLMPSQSSSLEGMLDKEPSIEEIRQAALNYNEVHPDKIKKWRNALRYRALFPSVNLDYDKTVNYDSGADRYYTGPHDWGVSLSWNIGNLIWNSYEDDVDTRSRLNTQVRLDLLDEINRVYFERLRLKREITISSLAQEELFQKELRLRELTAILNGYTGGYFSKKVKDLNNE